jgi:hypothetical protein
MLAIEQSRRALLRLFRTQQIAELDALFRTLRTDSRMSVFRRLSALGYLSSYSHAGRYYTLREIPKFDPDGLWVCRGVRFSRLGSLKSTAEHLVDVSPSGQFHAELSLRLGVRVQNTLLDLFESERIGRAPLGEQYLYVSARKRVAKAQIARRRDALEAAPLRAAGVPTQAIVDVLLEAIHGARVEPDPQAIALGLAARGSRVSVEDVDAILEAHGLKKTAGSSRSRRSRR